MTKRVLVCGSRNWDRPWLVYAVLDGLEMNHGPLCIIEGEARGADLMGRAWAEDRSRPFEPFPADWERNGRAAGPIRNRKMLAEGKPDLVVAFSDDLPNSKGTRDMVTIARAAGVPTVVVSGGGR